MFKTVRPDPLPEPGSQKRGPSGHIGYLLHQAAHAQRQRAEQALADLALTLPQFSVLTMLDAYPGHSNADLARLALLTPQTMSVIVTNLLKSGLLVRHPHQRHGRIKILRLSEAGSAMLEAAKRRVYAQEVPLLAGLSPAEEILLRDWLVRIAMPGPA